jgi:hypothetical protein
MWGYLVLGVIIGMLVLMLIYCVWSFVDDCSATSDLTERLLYRTDNLRTEVTSLQKRVSCLESDLSVVASKVLQKPQPTKENSDSDARSGTDSSEHSVEDDL